MRKDTQEFLRVATNFARYCIYLCNNYQVTLFSATVLLCLQNMAAINDAILNLGTYFCKSKSFL